LTDRTVGLSKWMAAAALGASLLLARPAAADQTLMEKDGWEVFLNGRIQTFANFNEGQGRPANGSVYVGTDANGMQPQLRSGGVENISDVLPEFQSSSGPTLTDQGLVREMRLRSGFTGNVLGFGIRKKLSDRTELLGYTAVTVGLDSEARRKFNAVRPDWRESFVRLTSFWGSLTVGRTLTLFSRGATEITYLYAYRYGVGFPGTISNFSQSTAGSVGFGVMGNGFGAGMVYATPVLGGFQLSVGGYDANTIPTASLINRARWPRAESEATFVRSFGTTGFVKLFANGAWQRLYDFDGKPLSADVYGTGFGGRFEIGPVRLGLAGHWGKGIGVTYSFEPHLSLYFDSATQTAQGDPNNPCSMGVFAACPQVKMRTVDGAYAQAMIALHKKVDWQLGAGITRVHQLPEDKDASLWRTDGVTSTGYITIRQQIGIGTGLIFHPDGNFHFTVEYFYAFFQWYKPVPANPGQGYPTQTLHAANAGFTYDF
jgi:hypothetical protein